MSLADELLADLEEDNNEDLAGLNPEADEDDLVPDDENLTEMEVDDDPLEKLDVKVSSIRELCKLRDSARLNRILKDIEIYASKPRVSSEMIGNVESDPEYQLIVEANSVAVEIDNEICKFFLRFPQALFSSCFSSSCYS